jgi:hypothetical protein
MRRTEVRPRKMKILVRRTVGWGGGDRDGYREREEKL